MHCSGSARIIFPHGSTGTEWIGGRICSHNQDTLSNRLTMHNVKLRAQVDVISHVGNGQIRNPL